MKTDKSLLLAVLGLVLFGVVMVGNASFVEAQTVFGDKFYYLKNQALWSVIGFGALFFFAKFPHRKLASFALPLFLFNVLLLVLVLFLGQETLGARRWLNFGSFVVQPSELAKFSLALFLAKVVSQRGGVLAFLLAPALVAFLVLIQPDLGTALVLAGMSTLVYFASGLPLTFLFLALPLGLVSVLALILTSDYRKQRLASFLNPGEDPLGASYHARQILIALGSGGLFGVGLGQSRQKYLFLPEAQTDSIFAVIGEELGFLGTGILILVFLFIVIRGLKIAFSVTDDFSKSLAVGIISWIGLQAFINVAGLVGLVPLTGIPLPFISYGGSSLVVNLAGAGVLLNISTTVRQAYRRRRR